jgi:hypothetical protein
MSIADPADAQFGGKVCIPVYVLHHEPPLGAVSQLPVDPVPATSAPAALPPTCIPWHSCRKICQTVASGRGSLLAAAAFRKLDRSPAGANSITMHSLLPDSTAQHGREQHTSTHQHQTQHRQANLAGVFALDSTALETLQAHERVLELLLEKT